MEQFKKFIPSIIGLILIGAGIFMYFRSNELSQVCTEKATATVVSMREEWSTDTSNNNESRYIYYPVIEYTANGQKVRGELGSGSNPPAYSVNDSVEILYNPNKTSEFIVAGDSQILTWAIPGGIGIIFLGVGIYFIFKK